MSLSFNWNTVLSSFDKRGTLLAQLKTMEDAFEKAGMTGCEVVEPTATSVKLKFTFEDGTSLTTSAIDIKGAQGDPATVAVGTTTTLSPGSSATVTNSGTASDAVLNFGIPKGDKGDTGEPGGVTTFGGQNGAITIGNGLEMSGKQLNAIDLNLTDTSTFDISTASDSRISSFWGTVYKAFNQGGTVGKVYGVGYFTVANSITAGAVDVDTGFTVSAPATAFYIYTGANCIARDANTDNAYMPTTLYIDTAGKVYLHWYLNTTTAGKSFIWQLPSCLYFFKDFGDQPLAKGILPFEQRMAALNPEELER